jgi:hypothetical protein
VSFAWYDGTFQGVNKQVDYTAKIDGLEFKAKSTFTVQKPSVSLTTTQTGTTNIFYTTTGIGLLLFGDPRAVTTGIQFTRSNTTIPSSFSGDFQFVQLINSQGTQITTTGVTFPSTSVGLDGCYPYVLNQTSMRDTPRQDLSGGTTVLQFADYNGRWDLFLMFKPSGVDSVWVPLKGLNWSWHGTATLIQGSNPPQWTPNGITEPGSPAGTDTTDYPIWTNLVVDPAGCNS